ncbi:SPRY domain-containing protein [Paenibacillus taichungensis]
MNGNMTLSNGNLTIVSAVAINEAGNIRATHGKISGKWYWELRLDAGATTLFAGIASKTYPITNAEYAGTSSDALKIRAYYGNSGNRLPENTSYGTTISVGNIIGVALDLDSGTLEFYKNGVSMGVSHTNLKGLGEVFPLFKSMGSTSRTITANFGATAFATPIPSGFKAYNDEVITRILIFHKSLYKYFENGLWKDISDVVSEKDYFDYGMNDISILPESAWSQLAGEVEICYYTDNPETTEVSFNIETRPFTLEEEWEDKDIEVLYYTDDPTATESVVTIETDLFTLAEEWEDKEIKIIEYTDDPSIAESTITLETEPFTLYDELGDNVDVLYYTDDPSKTSAELNYTSNYSPLDELEGDFDVFTWSDSNTSKNVQISSIPSPQLVKQTDDYYIYGDLLAIVDKLSSTNGTLRYAVSFNEGSTWEVCKFGKWRTIDISSLVTFKKSGMSHYDISLITSDALKNKGNKIRFAYYIEDNIHNSDPGIEIDNVQLKIDAATDTAKFENLAFYVLNTNATIQLSIDGNKLLGVLDDSDRGKVQYRIFLNNKPYYPTDGNFTPLAPSPQDININISERDLLFNQENTLKVEFQDYWGETDYWQTTFVGSYSGLMFMDETGEYLSDTFGGILKYLQFGEIYAGQTTIDQKVVIKNQLGYPVDEMLLTVNKDVLPSGVGVELSRQQAPFLATDYITYGLTKENETQEFYVRITSDIDAEPVSNGIFELRINAKKT